MFIVSGNLKSQPFKVLFEGKKITNMDGGLYEALVVLVSGEPDYTEGKLLGNYYLYGNLINLNGFLF